MLALKSYRPVLMIAALIFVPATVSRCAEEMVYVSADSAEIKVGSKVLGRVSYAQRLWAFKRQGAWYWVKVPGKEERGWIHNSAATPLPPTGARKQRLDAGYQAIETIKRLRAQGKFREALPFAEQYLNAMLEILGEHPSSADAMGTLGGLHQALGDYKRAEALFSRGLALERKIVGTNHKRTAITLNNLGNLNLDLGNHKRAEALFVESLNVRERLFGPDHVFLANPLQNLGLVYSNLGQYAKAEKTVRQSYEILKKAHGEESRELNTVRNSLATIYFHTAQFQRAKELFQKNLRIERQSLGEDHPTTVMTMGNIAAVHSQLREYQEAEQLRLHTVRLTRKIYGNRHPNVALGLNNLAVLYAEMGRRSECVPLLLESLEIRKEKLGDDHPDTAIAQENVASSYKAIGELDKAEKLYRKALESRINSFGEDHPDTAFVLWHLASIAGTKGDREEAVGMLQRSLAACRKTLVPEHPQTLRVLNSLGMEFNSLNRFDDSRRTYEECLAISSKINGRNHPDTAVIMENLAWLHAATGDFDRADELYEQTLEIIRKTAPDDDRLLAGSHSSRAVSLSAQKKWAAAAQEFDAQRRAAHREIAGTLPGLPTNEQLTFLSMNHRVALDQALTIGLQESHDQHLVDLSAEWLLNGKAVTGEVLAERTRLARRSTDPTVRERLNKLVTVQSQLAALSMRVPDQAQRQMYKDTLIRLTERESRLARELGVAVNSADQSAPWISLRTLRGRIPQGAVLVDFLQISPYDFSEYYKGGSRNPLRYVAWIIPPAGDQSIQIVDLGSLDEIHKKIKAARDTIASSAAGIGKVGEPVATKTARDALSSLSETILQPLLSAAGDVDQLILSPDGGLWYVPWAALPVDDDHFAVEQYLFTSIVTSRELVRTGEGSTTAGGRAVVFADPDYDRRAETVKKSGDAESLRALTSLISGVSRLPGTATEAKAIAPSLQALTGQKPQVWLESAAMESNFKQTRNAPIVVVSTHGFFLKDEKLPHLHGRNLALHARGLSKVKPQASGSAGLDWNRMSNPLLRCGLLFAGCNQRDIPLTDAGNDGVLTGMEILGTDLRGTELVVLSACETGLGDMRFGEGLAGLRQAFQLAGAESVASTLWQIPDQATARLMSDFFQNLADGMGRSEALQQAQRSRIRARRKQHMAAHPFFWAAFTLTGSERRSK